MSDDIEDTGTPKDRKFVEALARGLDVLRAFTHGSVVMGNQDIARITGLPKPTVSRMTYTLTKLGYLSYSQQLEKYQLDSGVLRSATPMCPICGCASWPNPTWTTSPAVPTPPWA